MSNSTGTKVIKDRLGGEYSLPIQLVRKSMRETDNPFIKLCRTYPGQILIAVITYILFQRILVKKIVYLILPPLLKKGIVPTTAITVSLAYFEIFMGIGFILFMRFVEGRNFAAMGFIRKNVLSNVLLGYLAGVFLFFVAMILTVLATGGRIEWAGTITPGFFLFALLGFLIQSSAEELNGRSYIFLSVSRNHPEWLAALTSGLIFGLIHLTNKGITPLSVTNIALAGIVFCLAVLLFENVWCVCAAHGAWNFSQGNIFGLAISGNDPGPSLFKATFNSENELLSGGIFGIEGNIVTTCLFLVIMVLLIFLLKKKAAKRAAA